MRRLLILGGTGTISGEAAKEMAAKSDWEVVLFNRGRCAGNMPEGVSLIRGDVQDEKGMAEKLEGLSFDAVADFIAFTPADVGRDIRLFAGKTGQYLFVSSASAYQKPPADGIITESTPLCNPYWTYSKNKIACEALLMDEHRRSGFPVTIVRPSHTYGEKSVPVALHGAKGSWQVIERMKAGKPVPVPGDGSTLWTMTHNSDFARGFAGLLGNPRALGQAVHITSDEALTWNQIYRAIARALGVQARLLHLSTDFLVACDPELEGPLMGDKANNAVFDNSKIKRLVPGFHASVRFDEGVRRTLSAVLAHPEYQTPDPEFDKWCDEVAAANAEGIARFWQNRMSIFEG